jgi:hypothetical protein
MLKAGSSKRLPAAASAQCPAVHQKYYGKRPSGSAPFTLVRDIHAWVCSDQTTPPPVSIVSEKADGFCANLLFTGGAVEIESKRGISFRKMGNRFEKLDAHVRSTFRTVFETGKTMKHPRAGALRELNAELVRDDGYGDNLGALMHGPMIPNCFRVFDCEFANSNVKLTLAEKLAYLRRHLGAEHVVKTVINTQLKVTLSDLAVLDEVMAKSEGVVARFYDGRTTKQGPRSAWQESARRTKHKVSLPVPLHLLAVGFTDIKSSLDGTEHSVPTHFVWGIETAARHFAVVLVDNKGHLCNPERIQQHKMHIDSTQFVSDLDGFKCTNASIAGENYNALLKMAHPLGAAASSLTKHQAQAAGNTYTIDPNRSSNFEMAAFKFLPVPVAGVVGANSLWLTGKVKGPGSVHFQAPQFLASLDYGCPIFRMLVPGYADPEAATIQPLSAEDLVFLASIRRDARAHANRVYWPVKVDLVHGIRGETPQLSDDEGPFQYSDDENEETPQPSDDETEASYIAKKWDFEARKRAKREEAGLPSLSDGL